MEWERSGETANYAWERAKANGGRADVDSDNLDLGVLTAYEFGEIEPEFLKVLAFHSDYDELKHNRF